MPVECMAREEVEALIDERLRERGGYSVDTTPDLVGVLNTLRPYTVVKTEEYERLLGIERAAVRAMTWLRYFPETSSAEVGVARKHLKEALK